MNHVNFLQGTPSPFTITTRLTPDTEELLAFENSYPTMLLLVGKRRRSAKYWVGIENRLANLTATSDPHERPVSN
jgi:hypothetical protein